MNKKYINIIIIIIVCILAVNIDSIVSYSQQEASQPSGEGIKADPKPDTDINADPKPDTDIDAGSNTDEDVDIEDIDLDLFIKDIYSKEEFYSPIDKRDPFKPFIKQVDPVLTELDPKFDPLAPPIKRYKLDQFQLVGVFWLENVPQAMLTDPEKNTYMLGIGDEVGNREGKIVEIRENGISVEEKIFFENPEGLRSVKLSKSILAFKE